MTERRILDGKNGDPDRGSLDSPPDPHTTVPRPSVLLRLAPLVLTACRTGNDPYSLYQAVLKDHSADTGRGFLPSVHERQLERFEKVVSWYEEGRLESTEDFLWSAGALVESDEARHLELASVLALKAAERGDPRGFTFHACATDLLLIDKGAPTQRYGTVPVYYPVIEEWRLYPVDPTTTDVERKGMGVPPLEELLAWAEQLNDEDITRRLRGELVHPVDPTRYPLNKAADDDE